MNTGSMIARHLAEKRSEVERNLRGVATTINDLDRELGSLMSREAKLWNEFAAIQIGEASVLPAQIQTMLDKRSKRLEAEHETVRRAGRRIKELVEILRTAAARKAASDDQTLRAEQERVQELYENDERVAVLKVEMTNLQEAAQGLQEKLERAVRERDEKAVAYLEDELFVYLHRRGFGTNGYSAWGLARKLDSWLANLIAYRKKAGDLKRLEDIPVWIETRLEKVVETLREKESADEAIHIEYFDAIRDKQEAAERSARELAEIDRQIEKEEAAVNAASSFISAAALASDSEMKKATDAFADMLSRWGVKSLEDAAARTATTKDDEIVAQLRRIAADKEAITEQINNLRPGLLEFEKRVKAIKDVESNLRSRGWTGHDHHFGGRYSKGQIDQLAKGMITAAALWDILQSAHRYPQRPSSYSSGRRSSSSSSSWGSGGGFGGSGGFGGGSSGGFGGGSWSSGGGFGGGSSSSGGGF